MSKRCMACKQKLPKRSRADRKCCSKECHRCPAPAAYRYICPDGRSYVGSTTDWSSRDENGLSRSNQRIEEAIKKYPPETWVYEILEKLPPGCSMFAKREAEQRHIDRFQTLDPEYGFNIHPAVWEGEYPVRVVARALKNPMARPIGPWLSKKQMAEHLGINSAWVDRYATNEAYRHLNFPQPAMLVGRDLWSVDGFWIVDDVNEWMCEIVAKETSSCR